MYHCAATVPRYSCKQLNKTYQSASTQGPKSPTVRAKFHFITYMKQNSPHRRWRLAHINQEEAGRRNLKRTLSKGQSACNTF